jgi:NADH:ubiquinone oxidoreductase subunit 6 (subunit J)
MAIRTDRLLVAALWLAGASALVALMLYLLGAVQVAVIELSVGAGLVTVLFVFAIGIAGDDPFAGRSIVPRPVAALAVLVSVLLLAYLNLPAVISGSFVGPTLPTVGTFASYLWRDRALDVLVQVVLIFCGVLGILGLLGQSSETVPHDQPAHKEALP